MHVIVPTTHTKEILYVRICIVSTYVLILCMYIILREFFINIYEYMYKLLPMCVRHVCIYAFYVHMYIGINIYIGSMESL